MASVVPQDEFIGFAPLQPQVRHHTLKHHAEEFEITGKLLRRSLCQSQCALKSSVIHLKTSLIIHRQCCVIIMLLLFCHCDVSRWSICRLRAIPPVQRNRKFYGTFLFSQIKSRINVYYAHFNFIKRRSNTKWRPTLQPVEILTSVSACVCLVCSQGSGGGTAHGAVWIHPRDQRWAGRQAGQHRLCAAEGQRQLGVCGLQWESKHDPWPLTLALSC